MPRLYRWIICLGICLFMATGQVQAAAMENFKIMVNIPSKTLLLYENDKVIREYPVAVGTSEHQTPCGEFAILAKEINPTWIKPIKNGETAVVIKSGPNNPLGYRWLEFAQLYGIHGTNSPNSIGGYVSNGCIRMREGDVEELYNLVAVKTPVKILYDRLVVTKDDRQVISLAVYPDEYNLQSLDVASVYKKLSDYGVAALVERRQIISALASSEETKIEIGRVISLLVLGKKLPNKGIEQNGEVYLPVFPIASEAKIAVTWDQNLQVMTSPYGVAPGYVINDILYINKQDLRAVFALGSSWYLDADTLYISGAKEE